MDSALIRMMVMAAALTLGLAGIARAADSLKIDGLPNDPRQFRAQVEQVIAKVDGVVQKLKGNQTAQALVLDLMQTRDNIMREIGKMDGAPGDAKWSPQEMRDSVNAMLRLLKDQYEKATAAAS
jgi:hypothetical protein